MNEEKTPKNKEKGQKQTRLEKIKEFEREAQNIKTQFNACQTFKETKGILRGAVRSVDYYEGRQWLDIKTKLPFEKPTVNIIQNLIDDKTASINSKIFKINYTINNDVAQTKDVTRFADYQMKEMGQTRLERKASKDGLVKGTFIWYFWWNEDKIGIGGATEGALEADAVDISDFAVSNPLEQDVQKQEYVIFRSRESVKKVKEMCSTLSEEEKDKYILPNNYDPVYTKDVEQLNEENCYVYLKFFKQDGEVFFIKCTENIVIQEPTSLNPYTNIKAIKERIDNSKDETDKGVYVEEGVNRRMMTSPDEATEEEQYEMKFKATLFPVVTGYFLERDNCIFGLSLAEQVIPIQKSINQMVATTMLTATKHAMPTVVVKEGALGTTSLDLSKAGGIVVDRLPAGQDGIKFLNPGSVPTTQYELAQSLISLIKDVYRANDVLNDGRNIASGMSAVAIQQLTAIQEKPVAQWQEALSRAIEDEAKILEMFYKLFYRNKKYSYNISDAELLEQNNMNKQMPIELQGATNQVQGQMANYQEGIFNGADYLDTPFNIIVEVGEGAKYSELMLTSSLETLFLNGTIANLSPEDLMMWAELVPDYVFPKKNEFKLLLKQKQNSMIAQLTQQNQILQQQLEQMAIRQQAVEQEFTNKINIYNENLKKLGIQAQNMSSNVSR